MVTNMYLSIITLNTNDLNAPIKRHSVDEQIENKNIMCVYTHAHISIHTHTRHTPQNERYTETKRMETDNSSKWK